MICLDDKEQSELLLAWEVPEDPYHRPLRPRYYTQFYAPKDFKKQQQFTKSFLELFAPDQSFLVAFTDWSQYESHEMDLIQAIRLSNGEKRSLIQSSGHLFSAKECAMATACFSLAIGYNWSSYLYIPKNKSTLFNWEGEIMDFWSDSKSALVGMHKLLRAYGLDYTEDAKKALPAK